MIKQKDREVGDTGFKPYVQYLNQNKGYLFFAIAVLSQLAFVVGQILQNSWMATNIENPEVSTLRLISVYLLIGFVSTLFLLSRFLSTVLLCLHSSKSLFSQLLHSLFRAPMSFYDSTSLGRLLSRVIISNMTIERKMILINNFHVPNNFFYLLTFPFHYCRSHQI